MYSSFLHDLIKFQQSVEDFRESIGEILFFVIVQLKIFVEK